MTPSVVWPAELPQGVLLSGKTAQITDPTVATPLVSGRVRVRLAFDAVPVTHRVSWRMSGEQAVLFEKFYRVTLLNGTLWFSMPLTVPQGEGPWPFQFVGPYAGPNKIGPCEWEISATLQQWDRPVEPLFIHITENDEIRQTEAGEIKILES